jgi:hypothetical protein
MLHLSCSIFHTYHHGNILVLFNYLETALVI